MGYLIDTNVLSELRKGSRRDPHVAAWVAGTHSKDMFISVLVIGEIRKGVESVRRRDVHGLTFVTRNTKDVARSGVRVLNPFEAPAPRVDR